MIVKPTVKELLTHAENRYELVVATSKRARQISSGYEKFTKTNSESPVTIAANEINEGKITLIRGDFEEIVSEADKEQELQEEKEIEKLKQENI